MLDRISDAELKALTEYERVVIYLFRSLTEGYSKDTLPTELPFKTSDIREAMTKARVEEIIPKLISNLADVRYTFDARRYMPAEVEQCWPVTWMAVKKGHYKFQRTKRRNLIDRDMLAALAPPTEDIADQTPPFVKALLGDDEQAMFTRVRYAGLITTFLGTLASPVQGHARTSVSYGQIEIDEVQAAQIANQTVIVPMSGKGGDDMLSWTQARNLNTYGVEKSRVKGLPVRALGLWKDDEGLVWIVEFTPHLEIDDISIANVRRFKFL